MKVVRNVSSGLAALALLGMPAMGAADSHEGEEIPFDEAHIFFELNNTDGDLGIHAKIDGEEWKQLSMEGANERFLLKINVRGALRSQGLTELFFESAEPSFDELDPEEFFERFPPGIYEVEGTTLEGDELESETELTHVLPGQPEPTVNGIPYVEDCDEGELPEFAADEEVVIAWDEVTLSHPELGLTGMPIEVVNYEVVVEIDETPWKVSATLPPEVRAMRLAPEILALGAGEEVKYEVLVREASYNQTAMESCFEVAGDEED